jgi:hypothetical protein
MRLLMDNTNSGLLADLNSYITPPDAGQANKGQYVQANFRITGVSGVSGRGSVAWLAGCQAGCQAGTTLGALWASWHACAARGFIIPLSSRCLVYVLHTHATTQLGPDYVTFDRPLPFNVSTAWKPEVHTWAPYTRTECGIEKLTIRAPWTPYAGMGREQGWNALNFWWTPHSWVDDVSILNTGVAWVLAVGRRNNATTQLVAACQVAVVQAIGTSRSAVRL